MAQAAAALRVAQLGAQLDAAVARLVPDRPWALVDYPRHHNCGDSALWLGQLTLARSRGARVVAALDRGSYRADRVPREAVVVIQAGGNFGGLYPSHHKLRLQILNDLRNRPIVQMPQSIKYADAQDRDDLRRAVAQHGDVTLMLRDRASYETALADFDCVVELVPDAAFALGAQRRRGRAQEALVTMSRTDREATHGAAGHTFDWLQPPRHSISRLAYQLAVKANSAVRRGVGSQLVAAPAYRLLARANLERGLRLLGRGEVVVTDRLHGHILCLLSDIPHVLVDDAFSKVRSFHETWTAGLAGAVLAPTWDDVPRALDELAGR